MKKHNLKPNAMKESDLQRVFNYPVYLRSSIIFTDKGSNIGKALIMALTAFVFYTR